MDLLFRGKAERAEHSQGLQQKCAPERRPGALPAPASAAVAPVQDVLHKKWVHANCYTVLGAVRHALRQLGKGCDAAQRGEVGIDARHRGLEVLLTIASIQGLVFLRRSMEFYSQMRHHDAAKSVVIVRDCDSTPTMVKYGNMQHMIQRYGGYMVPYLREDPFSGIMVRQWKTVSYDDFNKIHPRAGCLKGVVEIFAQHGHVTTVNVDARDGAGSDWWHTFKSLCSS